MLEKHGLDEILFCPAFCSPFKQDRPPIASPHHRLEMLKLVLADVPEFRVTSIELDRSGPSYTIDTLRQLQSKGVEYRLLLTEESSSFFLNWKESQEIIRLAPLLIGEKTFQISSTEVRERLKKKRYCGHLVPLKALDYIHQHRLYSPS